MDNSAQQTGSFDDYPQPNRPYYIVTAAVGRWLNNRLHVASGDVVKISPDTVGQKMDWWLFDGFSHTGRVAQSAIKNVGTGRWLDFSAQNPYVFTSGTQQFWEIWGAKPPCDGPGRIVITLSITSQAIGVTDDSDNVLKETPGADQCHDVWHFVEVPAEHLDAAR